MNSGSEDHAENKSPFPRRRGRQPVAAAEHQGGAGQAREGRDIADDLRKVEDMEIEKVVHKQASIGLKLATDGEFRRSWWHFDFLAKLTGCELFHPEEGHPVRGHPDPARRGARDRQARFSRRSSDAGAFQVPEKAVRDRACDAEDDDPVAGGAAFPRRPKSISKQVYPDIEAFFEDLAKPIARR